MRTDPLPTSLDCEVVMILDQKHMSREEQNVSTMCLEEVLLFCILWSQEDGSKFQNGPSMVLRSVLQFLDWGWGLRIMSSEKEPWL